MVSETKLFVPVKILSLAIFKHPVITEKHSVFPRTGYAVFLVVVWHGFRGGAVGLPLGVPRDPALAHKNIKGILHAVY